MQLKGLDLSWKGWKTWENEKMLAFSIISFSSNVFKALQSLQIVCSRINCLSRIIPGNLQPYRNNWLIDCMVFNFFSKTISVILQWQVHLTMLSGISLQKYSTKYSFQATGYFPTYPSSKQWTAAREKWIQLKGLLSALRKNQTSNLLFSSSTCFRLS